MRYLDLLPVLTSYLLKDCRPKGLRNYGELSAEDADQIDPIITHLATMSIELTRLFPAGPDDRLSDKNK